MRFGRSASDRMPVLSYTRAPSTPGIGGTAGTLPVLMKMRSARICRSPCSPALPTAPVMLTVCASMKRARALITRTFSMLSSLAKLAARSLGIRPFFACMAALNTASPLSAQAARRWPSTSSFLEGMQPMLMQVPPYIWSEASTRITSWPCWARSAASVLPALPKPMIRFWVESVCMMNRERIRRKEEGELPGCGTSACPMGTPQRDANPWHAN